MLLTEYYGTEHFIALPILLKEERLDLAVKGL